MKIDVLKKEDLTPQIQTQISDLFKQLAPDLKQANLDRVLDNSNKATLVYCVANGQILGIASLCEYLAISGNKGWIEDVVVDFNSRGQGIGRKLMEKLLDIAKEKELAEILLFSGHHRVPAIQMYKSLGFVLRESGLYFLSNR
ncbi:GNAT family N-acetyltransferase [Flagellimonas myxillae]|uniref:GNAT family N-acetyltransferase n=1 Tax=Flagellimonas myxillae TaxID=2942214 RepID=UPI00201E8B56|nr:GNAT family N-acetyltransferase [Muricauda myxillae]MCL6265222.1 GNAT family N-acetyltransferase [Muricauda myxillae]